jgi:hypothetical protein
MLPGVIANLSHEARLLESSTKHYCAVNDKGAMSIPRSRKQEDHHSMNLKNVLIEIYLTSNPLQ